MLNKLRDKRNEYMDEYEDALKEVEYLKCKIEVLDDIINDLEADEDDEDEVIEEVVANGVTYTL